MHINHDEFFSVNNVLRKYDDMKEEIKNLNISSAPQKFQSIYTTKLSYCLQCRKNTKSKIPKVAKTKKKEECFHQSVWCVIVKNKYLSNSSKLVEN